MLGNFLFAIGISTVKEGWFIDEFNLLFVKDVVNESEQATSLKIT